ncbi:hypothetical protein CMV_025019 [Castanea mollissima]|uniref:Uncharacterized protein n=1 Tax=Castanea mollissima TaxID=60419 RepID=A0A8J4VBW2_9ROSI|nr:hypothetical protein CMV_025019 [Castanea mollissima]
MSHPKRFTSSPSSSFSSSSTPQWKYEDGIYKIVGDDDVYIVAIDVHMHFNQPDHFVGIQVKPDNKEFYGIGERLKYTSQKLNASKLVEL